MFMTTQMTKSDDQLEWPSEMIKQSKDQTIKGANDQRIKQSKNQMSKESNE